MIPAVLDTNNPEHLGLMEYIVHDSRKFEDTLQMGFVLIKKNGKSIWACFQSAWHFGTLIEWKSDGKFRCLFEDETFEYEGDIKMDEGKALYKSAQEYAKGFYDTKKEDNVKGYGYKQKKEEKVGAATQIPSDHEYFEKAVAAEHLKKFILPESKSRLKLSEMKVGDYVYHDAQKKQAHRPKWLFLGEIIEIKNNSNFKIYFHYLTVTADIELGAYGHWYKIEKEHVKNPQYIAVQFPNMIKQWRQNKQALESFQ